MLIGTGEQRYRWMDGWGDVPQKDRGIAGWAHHGMAVTGDGHVIVCHPSDPTVLVFDGEGNLLRSWETDLTEAHGITLGKDGADECLWIADNGRKRREEYGYQYPDTGGRVVGRVVKCTLEGRTLMDLEPPPIPVYRDGDYMPTSVAVNEEGAGGSGDIWVADGYGQSYVHRYTRSGEYVGSINGEEGRAGRFICPHSIWIDRRKSEPELYVADRTNGRVQIYDLDGGFKRAFGSDFLTSPSGFAAQGELLIIAELRARLALVDIRDRLVGYLGDNLDSFVKTPRQAGARQG